jgi:hypothetical protein
MGDVTRFDETWHRLLTWTQGQTPSERLAALILDDEGYESIDPAHPLGGPDRGADALMQRNGQRWIMAVYFPRDQQSFATITAKFESDLASAQTKETDLVGLAFVTNQELRLGERESLRRLAEPIEIDIVHLERLTTVLDRPHMAGVREQFLGITAGPPAMLVSVKVDGAAGTFTDVDEFFSRIVDIEEKELVERNVELRDSPPAHIAVLPLSMHVLGYESPDAKHEPLSDDEIDDRIRALRSGLDRRRPRCCDYLSAIAWPAVHFEIENQAQSFLADVEVILTFRGARGVDFLLPENFEWQRLKDPSWERPLGPYEFPSPDLPNLRFREYPVSWENNADGDLEVTINLPELRPYPPKRLLDDDVVLIARTATDTALTVGYTVTARGYGTVFEGEPITLPVKTLSMFESIQEAFATAQNPDD